MDYQNLSESDPRYHTEGIRGMLRDMITHLRQDIDKVDEPKAQALFETSAEVLEGLMKAYEHYEQRSERAWQQ